MSTIETVLKNLNIIDLFDKIYSNEDLKIQNLIQNLLEAMIELSIDPSETIIRRFTCREIRQIL